MTPVSGTGIGLSHVSKNKLIEKGPNESRLVVSRNARLPQKR